MIVRRGFSTLPRLGHRIARVVFYMVDDNDFSAFDEVWDRVEGARDRAKPDGSEALPALAADAARAMRSYAAAAGRYPRERETFRALAGKEAEVLRLLREAFGVSPGRLSPVVTDIGELYRLATERAAAFRGMAQRAARRQALFTRLSRAEQAAAQTLAKILQRPPQRSSPKAWGSRSDRR